MARTNFTNDMRELKHELAEMGSMAEEAIEKVIRALKNKNPDLAKSIVRGDRALNDMERTIESHCLELMLKQQPVAGDLRSISTALKVVTDMERIGDHASDIADIALRSGNIEKLTNNEDLFQMASEAQIMVRDAIEAFVLQDVERAREITKQDDVVDRLFDKAKIDLIESAKQDRNDIDIAVDTLMIVKYLERIGDHAVNICEWTEFQVTGSVKHVRLL
ncbi:MAG: phosphate signaling complex protein PhoU [Clostridiales bacterium]|nr:phosphate signaling complex protein PhoU [Clostridiales bacterium]